MIFMYHGRSGSLVVTCVLVWTSLALVTASDSKFYSVLKFFSTHLLLALMCAPTTFGRKNIIVIIVSRNACLNVNFFKMTF